MNGMRLEDLAYLSGRKIILPSQPEPEWLRRNAEYARILSQPDPALSEAAVEPRERPGIVARLRMVLGRA